MSRAGVYAPPMRKAWDQLSKEQLERLYVAQRLSTLQIAERTGVNRETIRRLIHKHGIAMRSRAGKH